MSEEIRKMSIHKVYDYAEKLQQENQLIKEELQKANDTLDTHNELIRYQKSVLDEIREYIKERTDCRSSCRSLVYGDEILQILDKVKE